MQTTDASNLFQSQDQLLRAQERVQKSKYYANVGHPITLKSKAISTQLRGRNVWVTESGFTAKKIDLTTGKTRAILRGHTGPVTSIAFSNSKGKGREIVITGSWDKSIRVWDAQTGVPLGYTPDAHSDFVKTLLVIDELDILISGGSDKAIRVWDLSALSDLSVSSTPASLISNDDDSITDQMSNATLVDLPRLTFLEVLRSHLRPIECLASIPKPDSKEHILLSADSLGALKVWSISLSSHEKSSPLLKINEENDSKPHDIGIYQLKIWGDQIWTCSADNSALLSLFDPSKPSKPPTPIIRIPHSYYVKSFTFYPRLETLELDEFPSHFITGSTDETIRVWDLITEINESDAFESVVETKREQLRKSLAPQAKSKPVKELQWKAKPSAKVEGHWDEVSALDTVILSGTNGPQTYLLSASLDCTIRTWEWDEVLKGEFGKQMDLKKLVNNANVEVVDETDHGLLDEEERELAALMEA